MRSDGCGDATERGTKTGALTAAWTDRAEVLVSEDSSWVCVVAVSLKVEI